MGDICDLNNKRGCELLIDTGTYLTYIPIKLFDKIFKGYSISFFEDCENYNKGLLPEIIFELEGTDGTFNLVMEPADYLLKFKDQNGH